MKNLTVEQLEWLIVLTDERVREMADSPEKEMLRETAKELRTARQEAMKA